MEDFLSIYVRDELVSWFYASHKQEEDSAMQEQEIRSRISQNVDLVLKRAQTLACIKDRETAVQQQCVPINQTILDLISCAVNPQKLCQMDAHWHPWL